MRVICISRGSYGYGSELAEKLATSLGLPCIGREVLTDEATDRGIAVGKIEMAVVKRRPLSEWLAIEIDRYKAFVTERLCDLALAGGVVYHGRAGHLVLHGVPHVFRVRAIADAETRLGYVLARMRVDRDRARRYIEDVDEDHRRWVRALYNVDWEDPALYDITVSCSRLSLGNSAAALTQMAQMPDFQSTPVAERRLRDLLLASRARLAIGADERTRDLKVTVHAEDGKVSVTYPPWQSHKAEALSDVLEAVEGTRSVVCTVAATSIALIQERFDPDVEAFADLVAVAEKWGAAVELVRMVPGEGADPIEEAAGVPGSDMPSLSGENGGILDDVPEPLDDCEERGCGVPETIDRLVRVGRAGASYTVHGGPAELTSSLSQTEKYSLIAVGEVYLGRPGAVRKRLKRDLVSHLADHFRVPVLATDELKTQYLFGPQQWLRLVATGAIAALVYLVVFSTQQDILSFLAKEGTGNRILAAVLIALFVPVIAFTIGEFYRNVLKLMKLE